MSGIPEWVSVAALWALPVLGIVYLVVLVKLVVQFRSSGRLKATDRIIWLLAHLYAIGVLLKLSGIGPEFGRYYLSDIGFPVVLVVFYSALVLESRLKYDDRSTLEKLRLSDMEYTINRLKVVPFALAISVAYELFSGYVNANADAPVPYIGNFDWIDIAMYSLGSAALAGLLWWQIRLYKSYFASLEAVRSARARAAVPKAATATTSAPRKRYKKRVKRGVR